jgi:hypothetical protein
MRIHLKDYRNLLITYLAPQLSQVIVLALLLCVDIALQLVNPQLLRIFIDIMSKALADSMIFSRTALRCSASGTATAT